MGGAKAEEDKDKKKEERKITIPFRRERMKSFYDDLEKRLCPRRNFQSQVFPK